MIQPDYANPSAIQILRGSPNANWRKCWDCESESLHMDIVTPWVLCQHCKSQDTRLMKAATELLRRETTANAKKALEFVCKTISDCETLDSVARYGSREQALAACAGAIVDRCTDALKNLP